MRARSFALGALGLVVLGAGGLLLGPPLWLLDELPRRYPGCLYRVTTRARLIALTVDDGPDAATTPAILAELRRYGARATFFLIGERVKDQPSLVHRMTAEGHELGNHLGRDRPSIRLGAGDFERDLAETGRLLRSYGVVRWARPGGGWYSRKMIATMSRLGYRCVLGSVYPYDATVPSVPFARWFILRNVRPGAILVLHDGGARGHRTARILGEILPELARRGYRVVPLSELVGAAEVL